MRKSFFGDVHWMVWFRGKPNCKSHSCRCYRVNPGAVGQQLYLCCVRCYFVVGDGFFVLSFFASDTRVAVGNDLIKIDLICCSMMDDGPRQRTRRDVRVRRREHIELTTSICILKVGTRMLNGLEKDNCCPQLDDRREGDERSRRRRRSTD